MTGPFINTLDKLLAEHVPPDGAELVPVDMWSRDTYREIKMGDGSLSQEVLVRLNVDRYAGVLTVTQHGRTDLSMQQVRTLHELLGYVADIGARFHDLARAEIEQRREEEAKRQAEYQREREERIAAAKAERERIAAAMEDRKDTLLNELVEEEGRIRIRGLKRWRPVTVQVQEIGDGEYAPFFEYRYKSKHGYRESLTKQVQAFHVKLGSKFYSVWDEGVQDLREYDQADVLKKTVAGEYTSGLTTDGVAEDMS